MRPFFVLYFLISTTVKAHLSIRESDVRNLPDGRHLNISRFAFEHLKNHLYCPEECTSLLDTMKPIDVGLDQSAIMEIEHQSNSSHLGPTRRPRKHRRTPRIRSRSTPPVTYILIHECPTFSIGLFCLPTSAVIPLHNHPKMTVLSKILYGSMHIKAYDWLDPQPTNSLQHPYPVDLKLASLWVDADFRTPCEPSVLYPTMGGNIHSFTAITSCAVLDVLSPPYSGDPSYYREYPYPGLPGNEDGVGDGEGCVWLEEIEKPGNFVMIQQQYRGPIIDVFDS